jgi:rhodanese-related sulfurtransferase
VRNMKKKILGLLLFALFIIVSFMAFFMSSMSFNGVVEAFDQITAQEAYNMVSSDEATLLDVRTLEEYTFVGSPALYAGGEPITYLISWKLFGGINDNGQIIYKDNPDFDVLIEQTFGNSKDLALIVMCGFGGRSTGAANRLEQMGFTSVYEIDNRLKELASPPGGCGGFQGSNYQAETNGYYLGYRGYPGRLPNASVPSTIKVATITAQIENENDSVSWMDTGLPITQKIDPKKIPKLKEAETPPTTPSDNKNENDLNNLTETDPTETDLTGSNLSGSNLSGTNPTGTNLSGTNLTGSNLTGSNLSGTNPTGTNLPGSNLIGAQGIFPSLYQGYQSMPYFQQPAYSLPTPTKDYSSAIPQPNWVLPDQSFFQQLYLGPSLRYAWQPQSTSSTGLTSASSVYTPPPHS